ncbi:MAG TPA: hypothetical protein VMU41_17390 [Candidatus Binataceae bacterium]|nr:hypothetical protein [Candidatus Binataceae bacterium]
MGFVISAAPLILLIATTALLRNQWRRSLALLFIGPVIASFIVLTGGIIVDVITGLGGDYSLKGLPWLGLMFFLLVGVYAIYPRGAWVAVFVLSSWPFLGQASETRSLRVRLLPGLMVGLLAGILTAAALFLFFKSSALVDLIAVPNDPNTRHPSPLSIQITILTGLCDGGLLAYLSCRVRRSKGSDT